MLYNVYVVCTVYVCILCVVWVYSVVCVCCVYCAGVAWGGGRRWHQFSPVSFSLYFLRQEQAVRSACFCALRAGVTSTYLPIWLLCGFRCRPSSLYNKCFTHWAMSPTLTHCAISATLIKLSATHSHPQSTVLIATQSWKGMFRDSKSCIWDRKNKPEPARPHAHHHCIWF